MNGKNIVISWEGKSVSTKSDTIQIGAETVEISSVTSATFEAIRAGQKEWGMQTDFLIGYIEDIGTALLVGTAVNITVYNGTTPIFKGEASVTRCTIELQRGALARGDIAFLGNGPLVIPVTSITLNPTSITMNDDSSATIVATVLPENATYDDLMWYSTNTNVARVNNRGVVTAVAAGTCQIICSAQSDRQVYDSCSVTIQSIPVTAINVTPTSLNMAIGDDQQMDAEVVPSNASHELVEWSSSDTSVATVDLDGVVTAVGVGTCNIICSSTDGSGVQSTTPCSVYDPDNVPVTSVTIEPQGLDLNLGDYLYISAVVLPTYATNRNVNWYSDNTNVATVDENGYVVARNPGGCYIAAVAADGSGVYDEIFVTVT